MKHVDTDDELNDLLNNAYQYRQSHAEIIITVIDVNDAEIIEMSDKKDKILEAKQYSTAWTVSFDDVYLDNDTTSLDIKDIMIVR